MSPLIERKAKLDSRSRKQSYAFYLSRGLVEDLGRVAKDTGRSKSEVLEILARAGLEIHDKAKE